jgi:hypothetical protein
MADSGRPERYVVIERFLETSRQPVLMEPGEDPLPLSPGNFHLNWNGQAVTLEAWGEMRNLVRRVRSIQSKHRSRLEIEVERFRGRTGRLTLVDLAHPSNRDASRRGARLKYRERFRRSLARQFPGWRLVELSTETDLHHSLSPSFPRALLRKGATGMAAIGAAEDALEPDGALTFGLIWLDYLRLRERDLEVLGLVIFQPAGREQTTCHRVRYLDRRAATYAVFVHHADGSEEPVDPGDYTNFDTRVEPCCRPQLAVWAHDLAMILATIEGVERRDHSDGSVSLAVRGLEFARTSGGQVTFGLDQKQNGGEAHVREIEALALGLVQMRDSGASHRGLLYTRHPEAWLESQVRAHIEQIDARLLPHPLYGQVPQFAAGERGLLDVLAADRDGRLAILEVKATQDVHLPLQALDYWMRVKWHLERGEFQGRGYFPGIELRAEPPRLLLVAPALDFHPSNEAVLRYFSPEVEVDRVGVGIEWRKELRVMFRSSVAKLKPHARFRTD